MELLARLHNAGLTIYREGDHLVVSPGDRLTDELCRAIRDAKPQLLRALQVVPAELEAAVAAGVDAHSRFVTDAGPPLSPVQKRARQNVLAQLAANPSVKRVFVNRFENGVMIVTLGIRGIGTAELHLPRFNPESPEDYAALLKCVEGSS